MGESVTAEKLRPRIAPDLGAAAKLSFVVQAIAMVFSGMILDGGLMSMVTVVAVITYWFWFIILVIRRGRNPTRIDLTLARVGIFILWAIVFFIGAGIIPGF